MIVGARFSTDNNKLLMEVQSYVYGGRSGGLIKSDDQMFTACGYIFHIAKTAFLTNSEPNPLFFPERELLHQISEFDHRIIQPAHDLMAAYFRWLFRNTEVPALGHNEVNLCRFWQDIWIAYLQSEVTDLFFNNIPTAEAAVLAVARGNTKDGYDAEDRLMAALELRYQGAFINDRNVHRENTQ